VDELLKTLPAMGVSALYRHRNLIREYLDEQHLRFSASRPQDFSQSTKQTGWHSPTSFVLRLKLFEIIGEQNGVWFSLAGAAKSLSMVKAVASRVMRCNFNAYETDW